MSAFALRTNGGVHNRSERAAIVARLSGDRLAVWSLAAQSTIFEREAGRRLLANVRRTRDASVRADA
jgi:hypothetical protein